MLERLTAYCLIRAARHAWYGLKPSRGLPIVGGHEPKDIVQIVALKTVAGIEEGPGKGRRVWDGKRDLFDYLKSQIDSEISNLARSWTNRRTQRSSQAADRLGKSEARFLDGIVRSRQECPETLALRNEQEQHADDFVSGFLDFLGSEDELLVTVVGEVIDGARKPSQIADALGVPVQQVYSARKRLKRRLDAYSNSRAKKGGW